MNDAASEPEDRRAAAGDGAAPRIALGQGRALVPVPRPAARADFAAGLGRSHGVVAAGVAVVMGIGFVAGTAAFASRPQTVVLAQSSPQPVPPADPTMEALNRVQGEVRALHASLDGLRAAADDSRQADTIRGLKKSVELLKGDVESVKAASTASAGAVGQLGAKIDRLDRDPGPKLAEIAARLDKLDREPGARAVDAAADRAADKAADKAVEAKLAQVAAQLTARLDRVERQVASSEATGSLPPTPVASPAANPANSPTRAPLPPQHAAQPLQPAQPVQATVQPAPSPAAVVPPPRPEAAKIEQVKPGTATKPEVVARAEAAPPPRQPEVPPRPATVDGWLLRDVYGGVALVEGRAGGLREVAPGEYVPGVGEIRAIERRGRGWVVVTSRGLIQADNRW